MQFEDQWKYILSLLPNNLEESCKEYKALLRKRKIKSAEDFLRMILAYASADLSLQNICTWALSKNIADLTKPAFFYKICEAKEWLLYLLKYVINREFNNDNISDESLNISVVDATHIQGPGAVGSEWRIHTHIEVDKSGLRWVIKDIKITDEHKGENLQLYKAGENDLIVGDRAYATAKGIYSIIQQNANVLVRVNTSNIRIYNKDMIKIDFNNLSKNVLLNKTNYSEMIYIPVPPEKKTKSHKTCKLNKVCNWIKARLIGCKDKNGEIVWLISTVSMEILNDEALISIYRARWQIELLFKRLKSLAWLNKLKSPHKGPTACSWIIAKMLIVLLAENINNEANRNFSPSGGTGNN